MWREMPEHRLLYINQHRCNLIAEAADNRLVTRRTAQNAAHFTGLRIRLGSLLIAIGRTVCEDEVLEIHPAR
jgi:hypothetical protein